MLVRCIQIETNAELDLKPTETINFDILIFVGNWIYVSNQGHTN